MCSVLLICRARPHLTAPSPPIYLRLFLPSPYLEHCFSVSRTHPYGRGHMCREKSFQYCLKLSCTHRIELIIIRKVFFQNCAVLKYAWNKLPRLRLLKFEPAPATESCSTELPSCLAQIDTRPALMFAEPLSYPQAWDVVLQILSTCVFIYLCVFTGLGFSK